MLPIENILVARDFSEGAAQAVPYALDLASRNGAIRRGGVNTVEENNPHTASAARQKAEPLKGKT